MVWSGRRVRVRARILERGKAGITAVYIVGLGDATWRLRFVALLNWTVIAGLAS